MNSRDAIQLSIIYQLTTSSLYMPRKYSTYLQIIEFYRTHTPRQTSSKFHGVRKNIKCRLNPFMASLTHNRVKYQSSRYSTELHAAVAYDLLKLKVNHTKTRLNFPQLQNIYDEYLSGKTTFEETVYICVDIHKNATANNPHPIIIATTGNMPR